MKKIFVINNLGEQEPFSSKKVFNSARRAGASKELAQFITETIEKEVYDGMPTKEIYNRIKDLLFQREIKSGIRYSLKESIRKLGPAGFYFEKYIGEIFEQLDFGVKLNQLIDGRYVNNYEIDFLAKKDKQVVLGECKFHQVAGARVDLKVVLIAYSRFVDIKNGKIFKKFKLRPMLVTNTKFTQQVIKFAEGYKVDLLGWRYPLNRGLEYLIESEKMYPVTILPSANNYILSILAKEGIMLVSEIVHAKKEDLLKIGLKANQIEILKTEAMAIFNHVDFKHQK